MDPRTVPLLAAVLPLALAACAEPVPADTAGTDAALSPTSAPFSTEAPTNDQADRACSVVLRTARRLLSSWGGWETAYVGGQGWTVWEVQADVAAELLAAGAEPVLLFQGQDPSRWWEQREAQPADGLTPEGMVRYSFRIDEQGLSEPYAPPAFGAARIALIPALRLPDGARLFDHNRLSDPLAAYSLDRSDSWLLLDDSAVCWGDAGRPVRLIEAQVATTSGGYGGGYGVDTALWGAIETGRTEDPWASAWVHYRILDGNNAVVRDWSDAPAERAGDRLWTFALPSQAAACPHYCYSVVYQFAVAAWADGVESWDNLAGYGTDYRLSADAGGSMPVFRAPVAVLDQPVRLSWARWDGATLSGQVLVRNLDFDKRLTVVYSADGWATVGEAEASYERQASSSELEYWRFQIAPSPAGSTVRFALRYEVGGQTWWDNDWERDWALTATGGQVATVPAFD
jgi:hypothetical protein